MRLLERFFCFCDKATDKGVNGWGELPIPVSLDTDVMSGSLVIVLWHEARRP